MNKTTTEPPIGNKIRQLRKERRWTQQRLAKLLGITQGYLSLLEHGKGSFSAGQLLTLLRHFNVPLDYFIGKTPPPVGDRIQNALAAQGATHLAEKADLLPSEKLKAATSAIKEALISGDSARQIAAIAPVFVSHAGQINLTRLRNEFAELGLENRFGWAIESVQEAIKREFTDVLTREWRVKYRRADTVLTTFIAPFILLRPTAIPGQLPPLDVLDAEITTPEALKEVTESWSPIAQRWRIATRIETDDFANALRAARGAD